MAWKYYKENTDEFEKAKKDQIKINKDLNELNNTIEPLEERQKDIDTLISKQKNALNNKVISTPLTLMTKATGSVDDFFFHK